MEELVSYLKYATDEARRPGVPVKKVEINPLMHPDLKNSEGYVGTVAGIPFYTSPDVEIGFIRLHRIDGAHTMAFIQIKANITSTVLETKAEVPEVQTETKTGVIKSWFKKIFSRKE
jgi:hypothetical protein